MTEKRKTPAPFDLEQFYKNDCFPDRRTHTFTTGSYINLRKLYLPPLFGIDEEKIAELGKILCGLIMTMVDVAKSGHPGGSLSKVIQLITLLCSGTFRFDAEHPKNPGRDRLVWSAGHCSPLAHALNALVREILKYTETALLSKGLIPQEIPKYYLSLENLLKFRTLDGPSGHVESGKALADASTGSSGHGLCDALGRAIFLRSCGLPTNVFAIVGDAETEEGMTYEARNLAVATGASNLIVLLDKNGYGIDGPVGEVIADDRYVNHWLGLGWNVIEVDGHNIRELAYAYKIAESFTAGKLPTVIISHTIKGKGYGKLENTATSHGSQLSHDEYAQVMENLGFTNEYDFKHVMTEIREDIFFGDERKYFLERLNVAKEKILPESELVLMMEKALAGRPIADHTSIKRPDEMPVELVFKEGVPKATRFAMGAWLKWMKQHTSFFIDGAGDLAGSMVMTDSEKVYGIITPENPLGRSIRNGISEQCMAMMHVAMSQEVLPGGYRGMTAFGTYAVFLSMMENSIRMGLVNLAMNPEAKSFFIAIAAHDGPETGPDGATHHGRGNFPQYPVLKTWKPLDANEVVEVLFYACERDEPIILSVARPNTMVFERNEKTGVPPARETTKGAYVFRKYENNGKVKLPIVVSGSGMMENLLQALPRITEVFDVKIIYASCIERFEELRETEPKTAQKILSDSERKKVITLHNGEPRFLYPFLLPADYKARAFGIEKFLKSAKESEMYEQAGFDPDGIAKMILGR
jgi:transketolase